MEYRLDEIFELQMGKTPSRNCMEYWSQEKENKWISISDLTKSGKYIVETKEYISEKAVIDSGIALIPKNTVIMSFKLSIGKVAITGDDMYSNEAIMAFHDKKIIELHPSYVYYLLRAKKWTEGLNSAVLGMTLNKATLSKSTVYVHEKKKQNQIAEVLDKALQLIEYRKKQLQLLDTLVSARFVEMFGDPITNSKGLELVRLDSVVKLQRGFDLPIQDRNQNGEIDVYGANGILDKHDIPKISGGGIITGRSGSIGNVYYTFEDFWPLNTTLFSVEIYGNNITYLAHLLKYFDVSRFADGTGVPTLNRNNLHNKMIIKVDVKEQNQFADFVQSVSKSKF